MKSKKRRKNEKKFLDNNATLIKCTNCYNYNDCDRKANKMKDEANNIRTFCILSPNKKKRTLGKLTIGKINIPK